MRSFRYRLRLMHHAVQVLEVVEHSADIRSSTGIRGRRHPRLLDAVVTLGRFCERSDVVPVSWNPHVRRRKRNLWVVGFLNVRAGVSVGEECALHSEWAPDAFAEEITQPGFRELLDREAYGYEHGVLVLPLHPRFGSQGNVAEGTDYVREGRVGP